MTTAQRPQAQLQRIAYMSKATGEERDYFLVQIAMNRYIDILNLRTDRRYVALFKKMGLDK